MSLGEMEKMHGRIGVYGRVAYVSQQPWVQNNTVKNNIVFGGIHDNDFYDRVLTYCALKKDIEILPQGDATEIGEKVFLFLLFDIYRVFYSNGRK